MKHFKYGQNKNTFQIQCLAMESKTSPWRTRNSVVSDATTAKRTRRPQRENQTVWPKPLAWLGCLAVKGGWVRDAQKRSGRRDSPHSQQSKCQGGVQGVKGEFTINILRPPSTCSSLFTGMWHFLLPPCCLKIGRTRSSDSCVLASVGLWNEGCKYYPHFTNSRTEFKRTSVTGWEHPHPNLKSLGVLSESLPHTA